MPQVEDHTHTHRDFRLQSAVRLSSVMFLQRNFSDALEEQRQLITGQ